MQKFPSPKPTSSPKSPEVLEITPLTLITEENIKDPAIKLRYKEVAHDYLPLTVERVKAIGDYLEERINYFRSKGISNPVVLEVGAGSGRLTHFLNKKLADNNHGTKIIPIDDLSGSLEIGTDPVPVHAHIEKYKHVDALETFKPTIVICCMMTPEMDLSYEFREQASVLEYILIGHRMGTGEWWHTHGVGDFWNSKDREDEVPPFVEDGFERVEIKEISNILGYLNDDPEDPVLKDGRKFRFDSFRRK